MHSIYLSSLFCIIIFIDNKSYFNLYLKEFKEKNITKYHLFSGECEQPWWFPSWFRHFIYLNLCEVLTFIDLS